LIKTGSAVVFSPALGFVLALFLVLAVSWIFVRRTPLAVDNIFRILQFVSASLYSLGHGVCVVETGIYCAMLISETWKHFIVATRACTTGKPLRRRIGENYSAKENLDDEKTSAWGYWKATCPSFLPPICLSCPLSLSSSGGRGRG
jgi:phosphate/sulfate permease